MRFYFLLSFVFILFGCPPSEDFNDSICFGFDERQCAGDSFFSEDNPISSLDEKLIVIQDFLTEEGIEVFEIRYEDNFYEGVCEACFICPEQHRYFVRVMNEDQDKIESLDLLNLEIIDCHDVF